ncbi:MAG: glycosyltransferase [Acidobacteria bacterium]|nr:glycosyltransferase [Acidobacteriota bacterium]
MHRRLTATGGGNAVAAWAAQALATHHDLTLLTLGEVNLAELNRTYGSSLSASAMEILQLPPWKGKLLQSLPFPAEQAKLGALMMEASSLMRRRPFDVVIGTDNEADFGQVGLQYVHYPWHRAPLPHELRTIHRVPGLLPLYRWLSGPAMGVSLERLRRNRTLANSTFIAGKIRAVHGIESQVIYPPVPGGFPTIPWSEKEQGFVSIGRIHPTKRWTAAVHILDKVRKRGFAVALSIVGMPDSPDELAALRAAQQTRPWLRLHCAVPRGEMVRIVASKRYGLHLMEEEHFGIGVAELMRAGCVPFVHDSGGPPEIIGGQAELSFRSDEDAVEKICSVLGSEALQQRLLERLAPQRELFSEQRFMDEIRHEVESLAAACAAQNGRS